MVISTKKWAIASFTENSGSAIMAASCAQKWLISLFLQIRISNFSDFEHVVRGP